MTYLADEQSVHNSEPIELYDFTRGASRFPYTSAAEDILFNSSIFTATAMERSKIEDSGELGRSSITVTMPRDTAFLIDYLVSPPSEVTTLTLYRKHRHDDDASAVIIWIGRLLNLNWLDSTVELECEPVFTSIRRLGLRRQYSRSCTHALYSNKCGVNNTAYKLTGQVIGLSSNVVSVNLAGSHDDNYYSGGYVQWDYQGRKEKKMILSQIGTSLTLGGFPVGLVGGDTVEIFPGCNHTMAACNDKFNNVLNYGGQPFIPVKNPFGSIALW